MPNDINAFIRIGNLEVTMIRTEPAIQDCIDFNGAGAHFKRPWFFFATIAGIAFDFDRNKHPEINAPIFTEAILNLVFGPRCGGLDFLAGDILPYFEGLKVASNKGYLP